MEADEIRQRQHEGHALWVPDAQGRDPQPLAIDVDVFCWRCWAGPSRRGTCSVRRRATSATGALRHRCRPAPWWTAGGPRPDPLTHDQRGETPQAVARELRGLPSALKSASAPAGRSAVENQSVRADARVTGAHCAQRRQIGGARFDLSWGTEVVAVGVSFRDGHELLSHMGASSEGDEAAECLPNVRSHKLGARSERREVIGLSLRKERREPSRGSPTLLGSDVKLECIAGRMPARSRVVRALGTR